MRWQDTSSSFVIFGLRFDFIKFKNTFHARGSACSDTNTVEISREAPHTASTCSKHHEYHFLNRRIPLFHVPAVQIWSCRKKSKKQKKSTEYSKINQNDPKLGIYHVLTVSRQHKKLGSKIKKNKNSLPTAREDGSWQSLRLCRLLTEWQSAKVTVWMASTMACLCRLQFFANCLAVGKARQSANPALPTAGNSSWQRDLFAECRKKTVGKENCSRQRASFLYNAHFKHSRTRVINGWVLAGY